MADLPDPIEPGRFGALAAIGLGLMGSRMSARLMEHGFVLRGYDPSPERLAAFETLGGTPANSAKEAIQGTSAAILSLPDSEISKEVCLGLDGFSNPNRQPYFVYDTTTGRPEDAEEIATALSQNGVVYSDSTLSGNSESAERGQLVVMLGGTDKAYEFGNPIFAAIARSYHHVGAAGAGTRMKLIVNHVLTIHRMALAEGLVAAEMSGMNLDKTMEVLKDGVAYSKAMDVWGDQMIAGEHGVPFSRIRQNLKDARLILDQGLDVKAPLDLMEVVGHALAEGDSDGLGDFDTSAIIEVIRRRAGIGRVK
jgi:3-hydroxyisobutyrate dehydrogenase-like beta-hydroxyacid dehydrogenase